MHFFNSLHMEKGLKMARLVPSPFIPICRKGGRDVSIFTLGRKAAVWVRDRANATARYEQGQQRKPDPRYEGHPQKIVLIESVIRNRCLGVWFMGLYSLLNFSCTISCLFVNCKMYTPGFRFEMSI